MTTPTRDDSGEIARLVEGAREGDSAARDRLVEQHLPALRAFVRLKMRPGLRAKESCSDVVQSVCREMVGNLDKYEYRGESSFRSWLFRSALNKIIDKQRYWQAERRNAGREVAPIDSGSLAGGYATLSTPSRAVMGLEDVARIEAAFDRLPEHYREVVILSRIVGLPHREIAAQLGKTELATRTILRRALVQLAGILDEGAAQE